MPDFENIELRIEYDKRKMEFSLLMGEKIAADYSIALVFPYKDAKKLFNELGAVICKHELNEGDN